MTKTFQSVSFKGVTIKNRIGLSPMCQYSAVDGFVNDWHYVHYTTRAIGGAGLVMLEATAIAPEGRITASDLGIWSDNHIAELLRLATSIHNHGAVAAIQLAHAGRKASHDLPANGGKQLKPANGGWVTLAPSAIPFEDGDSEPQEVNKRQIIEIIEQFKQAAKRAFDAGFKIIEIHAAHGYLLHQFLSPASNKRDDNYGGSFENRIRFLLEVVAAVKEVWPADYPIFVRLSATDWVDGAWCLDETIELCKILQLQGVDLIDCSTGGNLPNVKIPVSDGYQVPFAEAIHSAGVPTSTVGLIYTAEQITSIFDNNKADMVMLGRVLLRNPYFPLQMASELNETIKWPIQYARAK